MVVKKKLDGAVDRIPAVKKIHKSDTILPNHSTTTMVKLYVSLIRSQLLYCTQIWRPHLMKDILTIERVQRRATKYILNDFTSCHKTRLLKLNLLPLMYRLADKIWARLEILKACCRSKYSIFRFV